MEKIHVFTDSAGDIPQEFVEKHQIEILPVQVTHEGRTFREYYDMRPQAYWKLLAESDEIPKTTQVTPAQFLDCYRRAHDNGYTHALGILMNAKGSGGFQSACIARDMYYEEYGTDMHIELVDSETYAMIYGRTVIDAARMRDQGDSFEAIMGVVHSRLMRSEAIMGVYSLRHLKKSGRISGGAAFVGEALGLKPISLVRAGEVKVCDKARGEKNLLNKMCELVKKRAHMPGKQTAGLLYGAVDEKKIEELEHLLLTEIGFAAVERWPIGISVITNTGPQAIAVMYYGESRE